MSISVRDLEEVMRRPSRAGMGAANPIAFVIGGGLSPGASIVLPAQFSDTGQAKVFTVGPSQLPTPMPPPVLSATEQQKIEALGTSAPPELAALTAYARAYQRNSGNLVSKATGAFSNLLKPNTPTSTVPVPSAPMSTGAKVGLALGLGGVATGVAWAAGLFGKSRRRR
jgi:hypothetical protein